MNNINCNQLFKLNKKDEYDRFNIDDKSCQLTLKEEDLITFNQHPYNTKKKILTVLRKAPGESTYFLVSDSNIEKKISDQGFNIPYIEYHKSVNSKYSSLFKQFQELVKKLDEIRTYRNAVLHLQEINEEEIDQYNKLSTSLYSIIAVN